MKGQIRILLCDDHAPVRKHAREILEVIEEFEIVGEAANGSAAVALARHLKPQFVLIDLNLPDFSGSEVTRRILADNPQTKVLAFSSETRWQAIEDLFAAGASGYVLKNGNASELLLGMITVISDGYFLSPGVRRPNQALDFPFSQAG